MVHLINESKIKLCFHINDNLTNDWVTSNLHFHIGPSLISFHRRWFHCHFRWTTSAHLCLVTCHDPSNVAAFSDRSFHKIESFSESSRGDLCKSWSALVSCRNFTQMTSLSFTSHFSKTPVFSIKKTSNPTYQSWRLIACILVKRDMPSVPMEFGTTWWNQSAKRQEALLTFLNASTARHFRIRTFIQTTIVRTLEPGYQFKNSSKVVKKK